MLLVLYDLNFDFTIRFKIIEQMNKTQLDFIAYVKLSIALQNYKCKFSISKYLRLIPKLNVLHDLYSIIVK